jgi:hypothetical protein
MKSEDHKMPESIREGMRVAFYLDTGKAPLIGYRTIRWHAPTRCWKAFDDAGMETNNGSGAIEDFIARGWYRPVDTLPSVANIDAAGKGKFSNPKDAISDSKVPLWLLSPIAKVHWALAQFAGMLKYGAWNWRVAGVRSSVYVSAIERHLDAYKSGEDLDPIDKTKHLGNIMACCALIMEAEAAGKLTDDRPPFINHRPTIEAGEALIGKLKEQYKDRTPRHWTIADEASA